MLEKIFAIQGEADFNQACLATYEFQKKHTEIYSRYLKALGKYDLPVTDYREIPFLPVEFYKSQDVISQGQIAETVFSSSGTTGMITSKHPVVNLALYEQSFRQAFTQFYGPVEDIAILALLPSYLERNGSSLIYMVDDLIKHSQQAESDYFLYNHDELLAKKGFYFEMYNSQFEK